MAFCWAIGHGAIGGAQPCPLRHVRVVPHSCRVPRARHTRVVSMAGDSSKPTRVDQSIQVVPGVTAALSAVDGAQPQTPAVILLGWHGSTAKNLRVYTKLYHGMNLPTLTLTAPFMATFNLLGSFRPQKRLSRALRTLLLTRPELRGRKVIFHAFSNAGVGLVRWMGEGAKDGTALPPGLCGGVVYDSAPCPLTLSKGVRAVLLSMGGKASVIAKFLIYLMFIWCGVAFRITRKGRSLDAEYWQDLAALTFPKRELFIFSDADEVMDANRVNALVDTKVEHSSSSLVRRLRFSDSPHVGHFMVHRKEYRAAITQLVDDVAERKPA